MCAMATPEALELMPHVSREIDQVTATDEAIAAMPVLAGLLVPFVVGLVAWSRWRGVTRVCLVVCALGLAAAAVAFRGVPDVGPWLPWVVAATAAVAALGALLGPDETTSPAAWWVAGTGLVLVGIVAMVLGWRGLDYNHWLWQSRTAPMWAALVGGALLIVLGFVGRALPDTGLIAVPVCLVLLGGALLALVWAGDWMLRGPNLLDRHDESESGWEKLPELVIGFGLLAGAFAVTRRWWSAAAMSVVLGLALAAGAVARDEMLWRLMW